MRQPLQYVAQPRIGLLAVDLGGLDQTVDLCAGSGAVDGIAERLQKSFELKPGAGQWRSINMLKRKTKQAPHAKLRGRSPLAVLERRFEREAAEAQDNVLDLVSQGNIYRTMFDALTSTYQARKQTDFCFDARKARLAKKTENLHNILQLALQLAPRDKLSATALRPNAQTFSDSGPQEASEASAASLSSRFIHQVDRSYASLSEAATESISNWLYKLVRHSSGTSAIFPSSQAQAPDLLSIEELLARRAAASAAELMQDLPGEELFDYREFVAYVLRYVAQKLPPQKRENVAPDKNYEREEWADNDEIRKSPHHLASILYWGGNHKIIYGDNLNPEVVDIIEKYKARSLSQIQKSEILTFARNEDLKRADEKIRSEQNSLVRKGWIKDSTSYVAAIRNAIRIENEVLNAPETDQPIIYNFLAEKDNRTFTSKRTHAALCQRLEEQKQRWMAEAEAEYQKFIQRHGELALNPYDRQSIESFLSEILEGFSPELAFSRIGTSAIVSTHVLMTIFSDRMLRGRSEIAPERLPWQKTLSRQFFLDLLPNIGTPMVREHFQFMGNLPSDEQAKLQQLARTAMQLNADERLSALARDEYLADLTEFAGATHNVGNMSEATQEKLFALLSERQTENADETALLEKLKHSEFAKAMSETNALVPSIVEQVAESFSIYHGYREYFEAWLAAVAEKFGIADIETSTTVPVRYGRPSRNFGVSMRGAAVEQFNNVDENWPLLRIMSRRYLLNHIQKDIRSPKFSWPKEFTDEFVSLITGGDVISDFSKIKDRVAKDLSHDYVTAFASLAIQRNPNAPNNEPIWEQLKRAQTVFYKRYHSETAIIDHLFRIDNYIYSLRDLSCVKIPSESRLEKNTALANHVIEGLSERARDLIANPLDAVTHDSLDPENTVEGMIGKIWRPKARFFPMLEFRNIRYGRFSSAMMDIHLARVEEDLDMVTTSVSEKKWDDIAKWVEAYSVAIFTPVRVLSPVMGGVQMLVSAVPNVIRASNADTRNDREKAVQSLFIGLLIDGLGEAAGPVLTSKTFSKFVSSIQFSQYIRSISFFGERAKRATQTLVYWVKDIRRGIGKLPLSLPLSEKKLFEVLNSTPLVASLVRGELRRVLQARPRLATNSMIYAQRTKLAYELIQGMDQRCDIVRLFRWDYLGDFAPVSYLGVRFDVDGVPYIADVATRHTRSLLGIAEGEVYVGLEAEWLARITAPQSGSTFKLRLLDPTEILLRQGLSSAYATDGLVVHQALWSASEGGFSQRYLQTFEYLRSRSSTSKGDLLDELVSKEAFRTSIRDRTAISAGGELNTVLKFVDIDLREIQRTDLPRKLQELIDDFLTEQVTSETVMLKLPLFRNINIEVESAMIGAARQAFSASGDGKSSDSLSKLLLTKADIDVLFDTISSDPRFLHSPISDTRINTRYKTLITTLKSSPLTQADFNDGIANFETINIPGLSKDAPPPAIEMQRRFVEGKLEPREKGALSVLISRAEAKELRTKALKTTKMIMEDWEPMSTSSIAAPQDFFLGLMGAGNDGRCFELVRIMSVALSRGTERKLIGNLFEAAATPSRASSRTFVHALNSFRSSPISTDSYARIEGFLDLNTIMETLVARTSGRTFQATYLEVRTTRHVVLVGAGEHQGGVQYFFYDPNIGIATFDSNIVLAQVLQKHFVTRKFDKFYKAHGSAEEPTYIVYELFPEKFADLPVGTRFTVQGLSGELTESR